MTEITLPGGAVVEVPDSVETVEGVTVHKHRAARHTIERWRKPVFTAIRDSYAPELQELENALTEILISRFVDYAAGIQLDMIGNIVGEGRNGKLDPQYRLWVRARILVNQSFGRVKDILAVMRAAEPAGVFFLEEYGWASFDVQFVEPPDAPGVDLAGLVRESRAAGVWSSVVLSSAPLSETFLFGADETEDVSTAGQGFSDYAVTAGGLLAVEYS